ncbi:MAG: hypothetical protein JSV26_07060 [bacterium]|nr:MAG: hypothetical protein JSV26_07060 [bacterium]
MKRRLRFLSLILAVLLTGCGYRFTAGYSAERFSLAKLQNATAEPRLADMFEEALLKAAGIRRRDGSPSLQVVLAEFSEVVQSVTSQGEPVRQEIYLTFEWRAESPSGGEDLSGRARVDRSYLWSPDPVTLDWNRRAALRLICEEAARGLSDRLAGIK